MVDNWSRIGRLILPRVCTLCGLPGCDAMDLCRGCYDDLPWNTPACPGCARPLAGPGPCGRCLSRPPAFDRAWSALRYALPVDRLVQGLKYNGDLAAGRLLGELMADAAGRAGLECPEAILPVPLHPARLRRRGYNQALELARPLARTLGVPIASGLCRRLRDTPAQIGLNARQRRRNLRGAFRLNDQAPDHVAIVDDVLTTGSTATALARLLHADGAARVELWTCARAAEPGR